MKYMCNDGNAAVEIEADSAQEAAQEYVDGGDWGDGLKTFWVDVWVTPASENHGFDAAGCERITITAHPDEPDCPHPAGHLWARPWELLGGLKENPGVWGQGGGVVGEDVCLLCGCSKHWTNWATRPDTGQEGLESVEYRPAAYLLDVQASEDGLYAIELDDGCYVIEVDDGGEVTLRLADGDDRVGGFRVEGGCWEEYETCEGCRWLTDGNCDAAANDSDEPGEVRCEEYAEVEGS